LGDATPKGGERVEAAIEFGSGELGVDGGEPVKGIGVLLEPVAAVRLLSL
jgi:hypothetical protein